MQQKIMPHHVSDEQGRPAGGYTEIVIAEDIGGAPILTHRLEWQNGPLAVDGQRRPPNGLFVESLAAAVIDRINFYQASPFHCKENADAVAYFQLGLAALQSRTKRREAAGIEGTHGVQAGHEQEAPAR